MEIVCYVEKDSVIVGVGLSDGNTGRYVTLGEAEQQGKTIPNDLEAINYRNLDERLFSRRLVRVINGG